MAREAGVRTDVIDASLKDYGELIANGFGEEDTSALIRLKRKK
jgi:3-hydroxyisobutyrate dehydrogenase